MKALKDGDRIWIGKRDEPSIRKALWVEFREDYTATSDHHRPYHEGAGFLGCAFTCNSNMRHFLRVDALAECVELAGSDCGEDRDNADCMMEQLLASGMVKLPAPSEVF